MQEYQHNLSYKSHNVDNDQDNNNNSQPPISSDPALLELLMQDNEEIELDLPLELQELTKACCGEARAERGKQFFLSEVLLERKNRLEEYETMGNSSSHEGFLNLPGQHVTV